VRGKINTHRSRADPRIRLSFVRSIVAAGVMIRMRVIGTSNDRDGRDSHDTRPRFQSRPIHISNTDFS